MAAGSSVGFEADLRDGALKRIVAATLNLSHFTFCVVIMLCVIRIVAIASLLCPLASAAVTESCAEERDETSLAQLHHIVHKRGSAVKTDHLNKEARGPTPMFNDGDAPPISTTNKCIMRLATQYFALYTALAIARILAFPVQGCRCSKYPGELVRLPAFYLLVR